MNPSDRRVFLRGASASLAIPLLESFAVPAVLGSQQTHQFPKRLVCVGVYLGFYQDDFFPKTTGRDYEISTVLQPIEKFRHEMTVFSGLDHRGRNGHEGWRAWMSGKATGSVSMDQLVADAVGDQTRFASLQVTCGSPPGAAKLSFTKEGVPLPMIGRPSVLYKTLFRSGSDKARMEYLLSTNRSMLDGLVAEARSLERSVTAKDREKLGEYFASIRDVEKKLQKQQLWLDRPTPKVDYPLPEFDPVAPDVALECESIMYDLMALALTTDSTRVLTFLIPGWSQVFTINDRKLSSGYHGLSHHGNDPQKIAEYNLVGMEHVKQLGGFLDKLKSTKDVNDKPLLDTTTVVYGSGMGDANTHDNTNLPTLVVGGGYRHGQHHRIDRKSASTRLLGDLYLTLMQQFGVASEEFAGARSNMNEYLVG